MSIPCRPADKCFQRPSGWGDRRIRLEPGQSGRQLEQQRQELPVGESQQEFAGQPQQQPRLPPAEHTAPPVSVVHGLRPSAIAVSRWFVPLRRLGRTKNSSLRRLVGPRGAKAAAGNLFRRLTAKHQRGSLRPSWGQHARGTAGLPGNDLPAEKRTVKCEVQCTVNHETRSRLFRIAVSRLPLNTSRSHSRFQMGYCKGLPVAGLAPVHGIPQPRTPIIGKQQ